MEELKIEVGKYYRTRDGHKVRIYATDAGGNYTVHGAVLCDEEWRGVTWTLDGTHVGGRGSDYDIISEWQEPLDFDWSCLPPWINKYIAMDESGKWFAYNAEPFKRESYWSTYGNCTHIPTEYTPKNFKGDWENSLFKNPNINN